MLSMKKWSGKIKIKNHLYPKLSSYGRQKLWDIKGKTSCFSLTFFSYLASKIIDVRNYSNYFTHSNFSIIALVCSNPEIIVVINGEI
jgi:hypothetical protein